MESFTNRNGFREFNVERDHPVHFELRLQEFRRTVEVVMDMVIALNDVIGRACTQHDRRGGAV